LLQPLRIP
jgi:hypothetical protein